MASNTFALRIFTLHAVVCSFVWLQAQAAFADPTPAERETARSLMQDGDRLRAAGDLRGALARFQSAHAIMHVPTTGYDVARTQAALGLLVEARGFAVEVMNSPVKQNEPQVFTQARKSATELAADLDARIPSVKTLVTPSSPAYTIAIDGVKLPAEAREISYRTNPGTHEIIVEAPGYATEKRSVKLAERQSVTLNLQLSAAAATLSPQPAPAPGGATLVEAPVQPAPVPSAPAAATRSDDSDPAGPGRVRGIIGLSVGGGALAAGVVTGLMSLAKVQDIKKDCDGDRCPTSRESEASSANTLANVANVTIPLGIIGIAYGVFELLTLPSAREPQAKQSRVSVELTGLGAVVKGTL